VVKIKTLIICLPLILLMALPCLAQESPTLPQIKQEHPRLLVTSGRLLRLRELARARTLQWRRLLGWALEPARKGAAVQDGPGLALSSLVLRKLDPKLSRQLGKQAVACALRGGLFGTVKDIKGRTLLSKGGNKDVLNIFRDGYRLLRPSSAKNQVFPVARYTVSGVTVKDQGGHFSKAAKTGDTYLLLQDGLLKANLLVRQIALTLDWAWESFTPAQRLGLAHWLSAQAEVFKNQGRGCFDTNSAAALSMSTLAGVAALGHAPRAEALLKDAWQDRYQKVLRPCLQKQGDGGAWFEGDTPGARAGLELVLAASAFKSAAEVTEMAQVVWFRDRLAYLMFHLLPGLSKSPKGLYRRIAPGGDAVLSQTEAADLVRVQMLALLALRPDDPSAGASRALLLDGRLQGVLAGHRLAFDFLWLDPVAATVPLATAPLSYLAPSAGRAVLRADWSEISTWLGFSCGPHFAMRQHLGAGGLTLYRHGPLLPRGGGYDGPTSTHALNYSIRSVAANTILVYDPKEYSWYDMRAGRQPKGTYSNDGGQRAWALFDQKGQPTKSAPWTASGLDSGKAPWSRLGDIYKVAQIEVMEDEPRYAYLRGRATKAYQGSTHKVKRLKRHLFLLRANGPDDAEAAEAVVVVDDLVLAKKGLSAHFVLHFKERPSAVRKLAKLAPGRWRGPASALVAVAGASRLDVVPIWPPDLRLDITGGAGVADSWVGSRNYPPRPPAVNPAPWRADFVAAPSELTERPLLHVLLPAQLDAPPPPALEPLKSKDSKVIGVVIKDPTWPRILALRLGQPLAQGSIEYSYPPGRSRHLVAGLLPETEYKVQVEPLSITVTPGPGLKNAKAGLWTLRVAPPKQDKKPRKRGGLGAQAREAGAQKKTQQPVKSQ
jgi:hypothetical protein